MKAYPTLYNGIRFRSRLEAKWAAMFDLLGWGYEYEPFDLNGYIPDFILNFYKPILVEVKPILDIDFKLFKSAAEKIDRSGWEGEAIIVGAKMFDSGNWLDSCSIGAFREDCGDCDMGMSWDVGNTILFNCKECKSISVCSDNGSFQCRKTGCYDGDHHMSSMQSSSHIQNLWNQATNQVQWRKR